MTRAPLLLILTPSHSLQGGVERIIESLAQGLPALGVEVVVGLARGRRFNDPQAFRAAFPSLRTVELDGSSGTRTGRVRGIQHALGTLKPDVVLIARLFDGYVAAALAKREGQALRLAVTVQAYEPEYLTDLAIYASFVDLCVTSGSLVAGAAARFTSLPADRIVSIPGGVRAASRFVVHEHGRPLRLGYVGRLDLEQKRVLDLADTLVELERLGIPWSCRVAGAGPAEHALHSALERLGLATRVIFDGWCDSARLYESVYPELDVLLHFAAFEGVTIAPREAMAHGVVPVVSRFVGSFAEGQFVHADNALTFPIGDSTAAAAAVQRLHQDRGLLQRLSASARASQTGIRSDDGALRAWAEAVHLTLGRPVRTAREVPVQPAPTGRLSRLGVPEGIAERLRRSLRLRASHRDPGSEWPHWSGSARPERLAEIAAFARIAEDEAARLAGLSPESRD